MVRTKSRMAVLRSSETSTEPDPEMHFYIQLSGYMKYSDGKVDKDWYETRIGIEVFHTKVERPDPHICKFDIEFLIRWLRELVEAKDSVKPYFTMEPMFTIMAEPIAGPTFLLRILLQAWGTVPMFFREDEGVALYLPADADSLLQFANELEAEVAAIAGRS